jgi:hypothetical protein
VGNCLIYGYHPVVVSDSIRYLFTVIRFPSGGSDPYTVHKRQEQ